jgi:hypothetical protein
MATRETLGTSKQGSPRFAFDVGDLTKSPSTFPRTGMSKPNRRSYRNLLPLVTFMILALLDSYAPATDIAQNIQQAVEISI